MFFCWEMCHTFLLHEPFESFLARFKSQSFVITFKLNIFPFHILFCYKAGYFEKKKLYYGAFLTVIVAVMTNILSL